MNGVHIGNFRRADNGRNIQVAERQLWRTDADGFVREAHWQRMAGGFALEGNRADAPVFSPPKKAQCNLSPIRNQYFVKHFKSVRGHPIRAIQPGPPSRLNHCASSNTKRRTRGACVLHNKWLSPRFTSSPE